MLSESRLRVVGTMAACGLLLAAVVGCCTDEQAAGPEVVPCPAEPLETTGCATPCPEPEVVFYPEPVAPADYITELPEGIMLPEGFHPLAGQYDPDSEDDNYNGWPRYIVCEADGMIMAYVPTQAIMMGGGIRINEVPAREVLVNHFYIDILEVSNRQYDEFHDHHSGRAGKSYRAYWIPDYNDHDPVRNVSWDEALDYARWADKELPTEAQWEAAARGDDRRIYPWGNDSESDVTRYLCNANTDRANYDGYDFAAPVMNFAAGVSPFGAFNMAGNVGEWCGDWFDPGRYAYPSREDPATGLMRGPKPFGDANYPNPQVKTSRTDRVGPGVGGQRAIRGGSYADPIERCRVDVRTSAAPGMRQPTVGFRCVLVLPPEDM